MAIEDFKNQSKLKTNLTQKDNVGLKDIYNEFKKAKNIETGKALEELNLLKDNVSNEVVYIMEHGEGYLVEHGDTISHINAMLPKGYSIKIHNPKQLLSNSNIRVTIKNNKLLINGKVDTSSSVRWGTDEQAKNNFEKYKASKWAQECFMTYDEEKQVFIAEDGALIISVNSVKSLDELRKKTIEYRELKADEQAVNIATEAGVMYDKKTNQYIAEDGRFMTTRDSVEDAYDLKKKIVKYRELLADEQASNWAEESGVTYNKDNKQYSYHNAELTIKRDDIGTLDELKSIVADFDEKLAENKAIAIANKLKDKGVVYNSDKQEYIIDGGKLVFSRNSIETTTELEGKINDYLEKLEKIKLEEEGKIVPKFIEYKVKKGDILWRIIKRNFQNLGMKNNKNKDIGSYYRKNKDVIVSINNLKIDKNGNPIIRIGKTIQLPTLYTEKKIEEETIVDKKKIETANIPNTDPEELTRTIDNLVKDMEAKLKSMSKQKKQQNIPLEKETTEQTILKKDLKDFVKNIVLQDDFLSERDILGIDIKESVTYNMCEIVVFTKLMGITKRTFQANLVNSKSNKGTYRMLYTGLHELTNSKENYLFIKFIESSKRKDEKDITIYSPKKGIYNIRYSIGGEGSFEKSFQVKEKEGKIYFEEITKTIELEKAKLQRKIIIHGLQVVTMFPTSFAEKITVDGYTTYLYRCKFTEPGNKKVFEGKFYINKDGELIEYTERKETKKF